jgi:hypothetical protein
MRRTFALLMALVVSSAGVRLLSACLSVEPVFVERETGGKGSGEAVCLGCLAQPQNCAGLIEECKADPRCAPAFACIEREACFDLPTLDDKINCGLPCAQDAGIQSSADPVISTYLVGLVACGQEKCAVDCKLSDAGIGL